jgi:hypothetical protein
VRRWGRFIVGCPSRVYSSVKEKGGVEPMIPTPPDTVSVAVVTASAV